MIEVCFSFSRPNCFPCLSVLLLRWYLGGGWGLDFLWISKPAVIALYVLFIEHRDCSCLSPENSMGQNSRVTVSLWGCWTELVRQSRPLQKKDWHIQVLTFKQVFLCTGFSSPSLLSPTCEKEKIYFANIWLTIQRANCKATKILLWESCFMTFCSQHRFFWFDWSLITAFWPIFLPCF